MTASRRLLVVDDDPLIVRFLSEALSSPAWEILTASDAMNAFMLARDRRPFMILTDVQMPSYGSGTDMVKALRQEKVLSSTPVLVITGMDLARAQKLLPEGDARVRLMGKPPDIEAIFAAIKDLTGVDGSATSPPAA